MLKPGIFTYKEADGCIGIYGTGMGVQRYPGEDKHRDRKSVV